MVLEGEQSSLLIDCASSPLLKMQQAGIDPLRLQYLIFTHAHPDHMYGFPMLMLDLWLLGHKTPLQVLAQSEALRTAQGLLTLFRADEWPGFCWPEYHEIRLDMDSSVLDLPDLHISACQAQHIIPSIALKIENKSSGCTMVYSGDTSPSERLARFARGAQVLLHEAAGRSEGHSSAADAGWVAQRSGVSKLFLIHYSALGADLNETLAEARKEFVGQVELARDLEAFEF